jgi:hypothetical protein
MVKSFQETKKPATGMVRAAAKIMAHRRLANGLGASGALKQRHQCAALIQGHQVVTATHVSVTNEDLRHRAAPRQLHHLKACCFVQIDTNLVNA